MDRTQEQFFHDHTSPEDPLLSELYRQTHIRFVNPNMATGHLQGKFLEFISVMKKPSVILEIGTFTGYSAICLSRGLTENGKLVTIEINDELREFAAVYFRRAGLEPKIIQLTGRAQDIVPTLGMMFDLVFIDGDKREYVEYYQLAKDRLNPSGLIIADNVLWGGKALDKDSGDPQTKGIIEFNRTIRSDNDMEIMTLPLRDGIMLIRRK